MAKQYRVNGMLQNMAAGSILPHEFIVSVSNDTHCTVSVAPNNPEMPVQYCVDFTDVLRDLKKGKRL